MIFSLMLFGLLFNVNVSIETEEILKIRVFFLSKFGLS